MVTLPPPLQTSDLTQGSSNAVAECISRGPPQLLEAFAARLLQRSPRAAAALRGEWIENSQLRCTVRQQIQPRKNPTHLTREGTDEAAFALLANQLAAAHVGSFPFSLTSEASHVGMSAWFVSALVYNWLGNVNGQWSRRLQNILRCVNLHAHRLPCNPLQHPCCFRSLDLFFFLPTATCLHNSHLSSHVPLHLLFFFFLKKKKTGPRSLSEQGLSAATTPLQAAGQGGFWQSLQNASGQTFFKFVKLWPMLLLRIRPSSPLRNHIFKGLRWLLPRARLFTISGVFNPASCWNLDFWWKQWLFSLQMTIPRNTPAKRQWSEAHGEIGPVNGAKKLKTVISTQTFSTFSSEQGTDEDM